ncbi:MAG: hypothetical protein HFJ09_12475 [Lachnospiraceae bacterium]|nr:hypothetical protein [Lachnospiraceae bacterium]
MGKQSDLTKGNIIKGLILFGLPLFFGSLFQQLYGTADVNFVSRILGKNAAAAVGSSKYWSSVRAVAIVYPLTWFIAAICFLGYYHYCSADI